uniref:F-box domain-containing protein n=1 Tax=Saccharum hybrid cultivar R570 TaxID=131158 RepID=A0A059PZK2_9POAL|nr:hypothetical protein SHCRBa_027_I07_F_120 [Saccharum hybrid cultivar R570]
MPPVRRARGAHRAAPYCRGWLPAWCSGGSDDDGGLGSDNDGTALSLPDDALSPVLARLPSAADVVRAAGTCRRWARVVAKDAAVLSGGLPPSLAGLTLGFFYQASGGARARRRRLVSSDAAQAQPCFVPTAAAARLTGLRCPSWTALADAVMGGELLENSRPVAARNGWLVLELQQERYTDGVTLCMSSYELRELGQSIVVCGVAYWHLRYTAFAVRLDTPEPAEVPMPLTGILNIPPCWRALGVDTDGKLIFIDAGICSDNPLRSHHLAVRTTKVFCPSTGTGDDDDGKWESTRVGNKLPCIRMKQLKVPRFGVKVNLRWFCEKSGNLIFTLGEGSSSPGAFVLNMATEHAEKVADGVDCHSWKYLVGYEMDGAAYLASSISRRPPDAILQGE